jgi:hypothetical protein
VGWGDRASDTCQHVIQRTCLWHAMSHGGTPTEHALEKVYWYFHCILSFMISR